MTEGPKPRPRTITTSEIGSFKSSRAAANIAAIQLLADCIFE